MKPFSFKAKAPGHNYSWRQQLQKNWVWEWRGLRGFSGAWLKSIWEVLVLSLQVVSSQIKIKCSKGAMDRVKIFYWLCWLADLEIFSGISILGEIILIPLLWIFLVVYLYHPLCFLIRVSCPRAGWLAGRRSRAGAGACHGSPLLQKHAPAQHCPAPYSKSLLLCFLAARDSCSQQPPCLEHWDKEMYNCIVILHDSAEKTRVKQQPPQNNQNCILTIHLCMLLWLCVILWFRKNKTDTEEEETHREIYFYLL